VACWLADWGLGLGTWFWGWIKGCMIDKTGLEWIGRDSELMGRDGGVACTKVGSDKMR
jgi:hypothetical protein